MSQVWPTLSEAHSILAAQPPPEGGGGWSLPVVRELLGDLETPVSAFAKLCPAGAPGFLLESVEGGERLGRYSFLGVQPTARLTFRRRVLEGGGERVSGTWQQGGGAPLACAESDPLSALRVRLATYRVLPVPAGMLPRFSGGAVGYLGYGAARYFERLPAHRQDPLGLPDAEFLLAEDLAIFDHVTHRLKLVAHAYLGDGVEAGYAAAVQRLDAMTARLREPHQLPPLAMGAVSGGGAPGAEVQAQSNMERDRYEAMVERVKAYIMAGDVFQVVPSQRFSVEAGPDPLSIYRTLRALNPSPYMYFLRLPQLTLVGTSPEILVRVQEGEVEYRPIAGTRRRGVDEAEDSALEAELRADVKERAEHVMLVDLGRNDIGRVCEAGSVSVRELMSVERYSHVMHLVSDVRGRLRPGCDALDALRACFPAGTVSGAPKLRAMEIIAELEEDERGPYAGALGYVGFGGNLDMAITIRTLVAAGGRLHFQAGGGVVADSVAASEYEESLAKAGVMRRAIALAQQRVDPNV